MIYFVAIAFASISCILGYIFGAMIGASKE